MLKSERQGTFDDSIFTESALAARAALPPCACILSLRRTGGSAGTPLPNAFVREFRMLLVAGRIGNATGYRR